MRGKPELEFMPICQIRPNLVLTYSKCLNLPHRPKGSGFSGALMLLNNSITNNQDDSNSCKIVLNSGNIRRLTTDPYYYQKLLGIELKNVKKEAYSGAMTSHSIKRLRRVINLMVAIAQDKEATNFKTGKQFKFKLNFITLTLPSAQGNVTDKELKKSALDPFLKAARRRWKLRSYVWRAEKQLNGNLHFHITTYCYIPHTDLRDEWNYQISKFGYIESFSKKHGHSSPNSTDVHSVRSVHNLSAYLVKYMSKDSRAKHNYIAIPPFKKAEEQLKPITGKIKIRRILSEKELLIDGKTWDCSENLKQKQKCEIEIDADTSDWLNQIDKNYNHQKKSTDNCTLYFFNPKQFKEAITGRYNQLYQEYLNYIRAFTREKKSLTVQLNT